MSDISRRLEKAEKYLQRGKPEAALEEFLSALEEDPKNDQVRQTAADLCLAQGRNSEAVPLLSYLFEEQVRTSDPGGISTYKKLAKIAHPAAMQSFHYGQLMVKKDKKEALEAFTLALKGFEKQGQEKHALAAAEQLARLAPTLANLRMVAEKAAYLGDGVTAAENFIQLGILTEQSVPGAGAESFEKAYNYNPASLKAVLYYARNLFSRNAVAECVAVLDRAVSSLESTPELRELYVRALMAARRPRDAEPIAWEMFTHDPKSADSIVSLIGVYIDAGDARAAVALARKLEQHETRAGRLREFITLIHEMTEKRQPAIDFLEYEVNLLNSNNLETEYCRTLGKMFQLYFMAGKYSKAGDALDRNADVDPYEPGHQTRLEMLRGKIDAGQFNTIATRLKSVAVAATTAPTPPTAPESAERETAGEESEPAVLEDFILQAEIYLQYGMRSKAMERLARISKLFPHQEDANLKLHSLYHDAGFTPKYQEAGPPAARAEPPAPAPAVPAPVHAENAVDNFARVTEITRNIYRQASVKNVLFSAVNEIGKHFNASRCVAGLCPLGKPPSAALEYCAPGVKQSDVMAIVKLIGLTQQLAVNGVVNLPNALNAAELLPATEYVQALTIASLLAVPLLDAGEQAGILILEQVTPRQWQQADVVVLKTIADQMVLAVSNARLRTLMKTLAVTEEKSGLLKRSSYLDVLLSEVRRSVQQQTPLTVMLINFGRASLLNREVGEAAVENMMQQMGLTLCSHVRQNDVAVRYDVTTIALLLSDTNEKNAFLVADKMRKVITPAKIPGTDKTPPMTVGIAEAVLQHQFDSADIVTEVINRVENALEMARAEGGNKAHSLAATMQPAG
ncbi:MAG TPA: tetratricopeptide repeat protein [Candidatus Saccharimonadales bacterium]|jgi:diguanylate cyclase (GGDEF)-like protein|nr:tetratricopeptide repeat protein [Candidatus Saccharimonadales bacterium]